jgi:DNA-binding beta-propeller fold protein YncE
LKRIDGVTGIVASGQAPRPAAASDSPLIAVGRWLAPAVAAKTFLTAGIALSPDGSLVYALGINGTQSTSGEVGSLGVFVFEANSLAMLGHWEPVADFVSLAVSQDGRFVYAAGMPGLDARGLETGQASSITVFDAKSGSVRLLAGNLGQSTITFPTTRLP